MAMKKMISMMVVVVMMMMGTVLGTVPPAERSALYDLYDATQGTRWFTSNNWLIGDPCDDNWYGIVQCAADFSGTAHIMTVSLLENTLNGTLPSSLSSLSWLTSMNLRRNFLSGTLPLLPSSLQSLDISECSLSGSLPSSLLTSALSSLYLFQNSLTGILPDLVCNVTQRDLENNHFSCPLPACCSSTGDGTCAPCY